MNKRRNFRCVLIGSQSRLIRCAELVLESGHQVCAVIASDPEVQRWAAQHDLRIVLPNCDISAALAEESFDYLFSIDNPFVVPECVLRSPQRLAINFHDSPLPKYAGVNATNWALINGETSHGVTWHVMTEQIDGGDILKQSTFSLRPQETALTLNGLCYDRSIELFAELIEELAEDRLTTTSQDLDQRTYFPSRKRPPGQCAIDWSRSATEIDALIRGLDHGSYANALGLPKLFLGDRIVIAKKIGLLDSRSQAAPGTITCIEDSRLSIATGTSDISFDELMSLDGRSLDPREALASTGLQKGDVLPCLDSRRVAAITRTHSELARHEKYWGDRLTHLEGVNLPFTKNRTEVHKQESSFGTRVQTPVNFLSLHNASENAGDVLLAALALYFSRIARAESLDLAFQHESLQSQIAGDELFFASHVPIRINVDAKQSFDEFYASVREQLQETRARGTYTRDLPLRSPKLSQSAERLCDLRLPVAIQRPSELHGDPNLANSDVVVVIPDDGKQVQWHGRGEAVDLAAVERMQEQFSVLLNELAEGTNCPVGELSITPKHEEHLLLKQWNQTDVECLHSACVHELFQSQVERTPDAIAVESEGQRLSYRELNARANQLAHQLRSMNVQAEDLVAIYMDRSVEMVVSLLGVLKAGAAYVPLDPHYPSDRISYMLTDTATRVVVTLESLASQLPPHGAELVCLDADAADVAQCSEENPEWNVNPDQLAYVIYTSGSTGKPKGVLISNRSISMHCQAVKQEYGYTPKDRIFQTASLSFDVGTEQIVPTLVSGATVVLAGSDVWDARQFCRDISRLQITFFSVTSTYWQQVVNEFVDQSRADDIACLRMVVVGGDVIPRESLRDWFASPLRSVRLVNAYGPTEATITTTSFEILSNGDESHLNSPIPIGRPWKNRKVYILDSFRNPVPIGVPGELCIGGAHVAHGYLNRPELTADKFVDDPFTPTAGGRLYRTGDMACYLPDGNIEFLGRVDEQVKVRGFRIELGEVESALSRHPAVREAVVLARQDRPGSKQLAAYLVAPRGERPSVSQLRDFLQETLPDYMVPENFVFLDCLPLTPNGKVDRKALPAPDQSRPELGTQFVVPQTPQQQLVASIWKQLLDCGQVGAHDNFFDLGGHSLLAIQLVNRVRDVFDVDIPLHAVFEAPTVEKLARRVEAASRHASQLSHVQIPRVSRDQQWPVSFAQQRLWFLDRLEPGNASYVFQSPRRLVGPLDVAALERALTETVGRHESLRTTIVEVEGQPVQRIADCLPVELPIVDLASDGADRRESRLQQLLSAQRQPFDLAKGPLVRVQLVRLAEQEHMLVVTMHHIITDGWSMNVFYRDLAAYYEAFCEGRSKSMPNLPVQYVDYAVWQREWLQEDVLQRQLPYWRQQLGGQPGELDLPTDRPRPAVQSFRGGCETIELSNELTSAVREFNRRESVTLFMTLLAAFKLLLSRHSGQEDLSIGTPVSNRHHTDLENQIGMFLNTLVLRTDLSGQPSFRDLVTRVKAASLDAFANQDIPFEQLVEDLQPERDLSRTPFFQAMFNLLAEDNNRQWANLTTETVSAEEQEAKFELTLYALEREQSIQLELVYNTDLYSQDYMECLLEQYQHLLAQVVSDPEKQTHEYSLLTFARKRDLPDPTVSLPANWCGAVTTHLRTQAERAPERVAVSDGECEWTYSQLNATANRIANALVSGGIQREDVVAIYAHRSASIACALMGILKAGAAFSILDPGYPSARLESYVCRSKAKALIHMDAAGPLPERLNEIVQTLPNGVQVLPEGSPRVVAESLKDHASEDPHVEIQPNDLAYVAFTSGTTGVPSAIEGTHRPLSHFLDWHCREFELQQTDRFGLLSGLSHDPLLRDIFTPLWTGATLCVPPADEFSSGQLAGWFDQAEITVAHLTPAMAEFISGSMSVGSTPPKLASLRWVFFGGELLLRRRIAKMRELAPAAKFVNFYGATETPQAMGYYLIGDDDSAIAKQVVPLGRGIRGVQLLVLNAAGDMAGIGESGIIYVRTPYLSRGYRDDPTLTKRKFIANSFTLDPEDYLYKTGDVGRYLPDGNVEFLGRTDEQVKVRGFRVELGEVEVVLGGHPAVRQAVVIARVEESGDGTLVGYVTHDEAEPPTISELRRFLAQKVPEFMIPSAFVFLDDLPLTPNGKVDHRALPAPDADRPVQDIEFVGPQTDTEIEVAEIWVALLGVSRLGIDDRFFDVGGHSLLATQMFSRLRDHFGVEPSLREFFAAPTIRNLAEIVEEAMLAGISSEAFDEILGQ